MESEQAGQVDITAIPTADNNQAMAMTNRFRSVPQLAINYYGLSYLVKPFNIKIRQALERALPTTTRENSSSSHFASGGPCYYSTK
jgi:hypothetical protein